MKENTWFHKVEDGELGPFSLNEMKKKLVFEDVFLDTLVRRKGCSDWIQVREVEAIQEPLPRPWVRFWARVFDLQLMSLLFMIFFSAYQPKVLNHQVVIFFLSIVFWVFVEPLLLSEWGTTPGKSFFRIDVKKNGGLKPTYGEAFKRSFAVFVRGQGCGIPIVNWIASLKAYSKLNKENATSWDQEFGFEVKHGKVGGIRVTLYILFSWFFSAFL